MSTRLVYVCAAILIAVIIVFSIWLNMNYRCVRYHSEWRTDCDQFGTSQTCRTYPIQVCDQYVPR